MSEADYATISTRGGQLMLIRMRVDKPLTLDAVGSTDINAAALSFNARDCAGALSVIVLTSARSADARCHGGVVARVFADCPPTPTWRWASP